MKFGRFVTSGLDIVIERNGGAGEIFRSQPDRENRRDKTRSRPTTPARSEPFCCYRPVLTASAPAASEQLPLARRVQMWPRCDYAFYGVMRRRGLGDAVERIRCDRPNWCARRLGGGIPRRLPAAASTACTCNRPRNTRLAKALCPSRRYWSLPPCPLRVRRRRRKGGYVASFTRRSQSARLPNAPRNALSALHPPWSMACAQGRDCRFGTS